MKLIYFTAKKFQNQSADSLYIENLARAFSELLADNFLLVAASKRESQLSDMNTHILNLRVWGKSAFFYFWAPYLYYFCWTPFFILQKKLYQEDCVFFLGDTRLIFILLFWKKIFRFKYKICSDWHMYYDNWPSRLAANCSDYLVSTSEKLKNIISQNNPQADLKKILVAYGGVDIRKFGGQVDKQSLRVQLQLPNDKKLVGYVGFFKTMNLSKGLDTMIAGLKYLDSDIMMAFIGGTENQIKEYEKYAADLGVADRCLFLGRKEFAQVILYEKAMDVLVIPYPDQPHFRDFGFPMKVYEYMAGQVPIVYSQLDLVEEIISDCAFGFAPDNPEDLAVAVKNVFNNYQAALDKAKMAYEKVGSYTWEKKAKNIINFLIR